MRSSLLPLVLLGFFAATAALADREWPVEAYAPAVARANARHHGERHDPQEDNPRLRPIFATADARAIQGLTNSPPDYPGFIKLFWRVKKSVLLRRYGIRWHSPADLNPNRSYE